MRRLAGPGALLFAGTLAGAALGYAFFVVLGRVLPPADVGAVGSLVALSTIASVPGLGLQLETARRVAAEGATPPVRALGLLAAVVGAVPTVILLGCAPWLTHLLHLPSALVVVLVAVGVVPMTFVYAGMGALQGTERFAALGGIALATGLAKVAAAAVPAATGPSVPVVAAVYSLGWFALAALALALLPRARAGALPRAVAVGPGVRAALLAAVPTAGLLVLSSLDVLLARRHLAPAGSGVYTMGALFEKVAFWGPQFIATMAYPALARPADRAGALRRALAATAGLGVAGTLVVAVAGQPLVRLAAGPAYVGPLGGRAWVFCALGAGLALVQVLVYADLAIGGRRVGVAVWASAATAVVAVGLHHATPGAVAAVMLAVTLALAVVAATLTTRRGRAVPG